VVRARFGREIKTGALAMPTIAALRDRIIALILVGALGVWPITATAGLPQKKLPAGEINAAQFVYLTDTSRTDRIWEAHLYERLHNTQIRLRSDQEFAQFCIRDRKGKVSLKGTVLHINARGVTFWVEDKVFAIRVGQNLEEAMRKSLTDDDVIILNQDIRAPEPISKTGVVAFEMRGKPWDQVLEWLSDQTGLPLLTTQKPKGAFTFASREKRGYTLPEIIDILNEALAQQKLLLVRRDRSIFLVSTGEKIDPSLVPRIPLDELVLRGQTELVSVVLPLRKLQAGEIDRDVEKLLGPFGKVAALAKSNQLVLQDSAGNLKSILRILKGLEEKEAKLPGKQNAPPQAAKAFTLDIRGKPWNQVLEWLSEQTSLPVYASSVPTGTVTLMSPKEKTYTIPEVIDLLNDALGGQNYRLIRLEQAYLLAARDQKFDGPLPRVRPEDLDQHGNTEIVSIVVPLKTLTAAELKSDVEKLLGPQGTVVALEKANKLVVRGCVGDLKQILQTIRETEERGKPPKP
jgi:hypothetical protein